MSVGVGLAEGGARASLAAVSTMTSLVVRLNTVGEGGGRPGSEQLMRTCAVRRRVPNKTTGAEEEEEEEAEEAAAAEEEAEAKEEGVLEEEEVVEVEAAAEAEAAETWVPVVCCEEVVSWIGSGGGATVASCVKWSRVGSRTK